MKAEFHQVEGEMPTQKSALQKMPPPPQKKKLETYFKVYKIFCIKSFAFS